MLLQLTFRYPPHIYAESSSAGDYGSYVGEVEKIFADHLTPAEDGLHWAGLICISLCAEGFVFSTLAGHVLVGIAFLSACLAGIIWRSASQAPASEASSRSKLRAALLAAAAAIIFFVGSTMLIKWFSHHRVRSAAFPPRSSGVSIPARTGIDDSSYQGVILWPKAPKKVVVIPPLPHARAVTAARINKLLVIPFQGYYAYFKAPAKRPGRKAHRAHGIPTSLDIRSTDWHPLMMEAHQALAAPVDLACCREIEVAILNADNRPGRIEIAVVLNDERNSRSLYLGTRPVESSEPPGFRLSRPPVEEALRFALPPKSAIQRFDEIEVVFMPSAERALGGVKIAIIEFRLAPR
jgi:hypothetical protein